MMTTPGRAGTVRRLAGVGMAFAFTVLSSVCAKPPPVVPSPGIDDATC